MRIAEKFNEDLYSSNSQGQLLNTIKVPLNLHYLTDQLPSPNYDPLDQNRMSVNTEYQGLNLSKKRESVDNKENTEKFQKKESSREQSLEPSKEFLFY